MRSARCTTVAVVPATATSPEMPATARVRTGACSAGTVCQRHSPTGSTPRTMPIPVHVRSRTATTSVPIAAIDSCSSPSPSTASCSPLPGSSRRDQFPVALTTRIRSGSANQRMASAGWVRVTTSAEPCSSRMTRPVTVSTRAGSAAGNDALDPVSCSVTAARIPSAPTTPSTTGHALGTISSTTSSAVPVKVTLSASRRTPIGISRSVSTGSTVPSAGAATRRPNGAPPSSALAAWTSEKASVAKRGSSNSSCGARRNARRIQRHTGRRSVASRSRATTEPSSSPTRAASRAAISS